MDVRTERPVSREELQAVLHEEPTKVTQKTWKPVTGGLLSIIGGYLNILTGVLLIVGVSSGFLSLFAGTGIGVLLIVLGIISVTGGASAIRRRSWGMALAGSIAALAPTLSAVPGTLSIIFVTLGKPEFEK